MLQGFAVGRLGKDAELKETDAGMPVSNFSIATTVGFGDREKTLWIDCTLWGKQAEALAQYLTKGKQIAVAGEISEVKAWISDGNGGEARAAIKLTVRELTLCGDAPQKTKPA